MCAAIFESAVLNAPAARAHDITCMVSWVHGEVCLWPHLTSLMHNLYGLAGCGHYDADVVMLYHGAHMLT